MDRWVDGGPVEWDDKAMHDKIIEMHSEEMGEEVRRNKEIGKWIRQQIAQGR